MRPDTLLCQEAANLRFIDKYRDEFDRLLREELELLAPDRVDKELGWNNPDDFRPRAGEVLYRLYASDGTLIYVGITKNLLQRLRGHASTQPWWDEVSFLVRETFDTRVDVQFAEMKAILIEQPRENIVGKEGYFTIEVLRSIAKNKACDQLAAKYESEVDELSQELCCMWGIEEPLNEGCES